MLTEPMLPISKNPIWTQRYSFFFTYTSKFVKKYHFSVILALLLP